MLLGNYSPFNRLPLTFRSGTLTAGANQAFSPANYGKRGWSPMVWQDGASQGSPEIGYPSGYYGRGWKLPLGISATTTKKQFLSGTSAVISFGGSATGSCARPCSGLATITFSATGTGGLVVPASGIASITFDAYANIVGRLSAEGIATITFDAVAELEALGWMSGTADIEVTASALPRGIGWMTGTTEEQGLSVVGITNAVWNAVASDYVTADTMGQKLNSAAVGGIDYDALADAVWDADVTTHEAADSFGLYVQKKLLTLAKFLGLK